jgi:dynactin complex subunit
MDLESVLPKTDTTFAFNHIPIPVCQITKSNEADVIATLKRALEMRVIAEAEARQIVIKKRKLLSNHLFSFLLILFVFLEEEFRTILVDWERETFSLSRENSSLKVTVQTLTEERSKHDNVLRRMMNEKGDLEIQVDERQKQIEEMQEELDDLRMKFRQRDVQHFKEKELLKSDLDLKRELDELNRNRQLQMKESKMKVSLLFLFDHLSY